MFRKVIGVVVALFLVFQANSQSFSRKVTIPPVRQISQVTPAGIVHYLYFEGAYYNEPFGLLPQYEFHTPVAPEGSTFHLSISHAEYENLEFPHEIGNLEDIEKIPDKLHFHTEQICEGNQHRVILHLLPFILSPEGVIKQLTSFILTADEVPDTTCQKRYIPQFVENSVLASGDWFKIAVDRNGVYKLTWEELTQSGMDFTNVNPDHIRIFGNSGKMLPERNGDPREDDLSEIAIMVEDGGDGSFGPGDYILFYGQGTDLWEFVPLRMAFEFVRHRYSDFNYFYITIMPGQGKRIRNQDPVSAQQCQVIRKYHDYATFSLDSINLIRSGAEWYSHEFSDITSREYLFEFPNRAKDEIVFVSADFAARSTQPSNFILTINGEPLFEAPVSPIPPNNTTRYANEVSRTKRVGVYDNENITITVTYDKPNPQSKGWLNFIDVTVMRYLIYGEGQMSFRNIFAMYNDSIANYRIYNGGKNITIWDVTELHDVVKVSYQQLGDTASFYTRSDRLREYVAFDSNSLFTPLYLGKIDNQNLHGLGPADMIIVSHPDFLSQALRLKSLHETYDQFKVHVVTPQQIFNEFSSGKQDPAAIRDFVRSIYYKSQDPVNLKYLLLFGDGSYDPKNRIKNNRNFIPTFQSRASLMYTTSYVTDDFYGLMDPNEGADAAGNLDIGVGRLPVNTPEEAKLLTDKIERYITVTPQNSGDWKNRFCFIADDEDDNLHIIQVDSILADILENNLKQINLNKIYFDAFRQEKTSVGDRYPDVTEAIYQQIHEGTLILNYTGHGGEVALAHERVIQISDIQSWTNYHRLPLVITATCEFAPFDNPAITSAGEHVVLNPNGGGIGLLSTTRLAFASANIMLNKRIYDTLVRYDPVRGIRFGDLIKYSKIPSNINYRNFTLLGDPALKLPLPQYLVVIDSINGKFAPTSKDTLNACSLVSFSGYIAHYLSPDEPDISFNGVLYPTLYDKPSKIATLANDPRSQVFQFELQKDVLSHGIVQIQNGRFRFSTIIPKDINYQYGQGKLSLYATNGTIEASGYFNGFIIGGYETGVTDQEGPEIDLYLNARPFYNGSVTHNSPILYAALNDISGINFLGIGIGHDITVQLEGPVHKSFVLNQYFTPSLNDFRSGTIVFPIHQLPEGDYTLRLKAWDMLNNSSSSSIYFTVSNNIPLAVSGVMNYPNPFSEETWFTFRHSLFGNTLNITIRIFDLAGNLVHTIGPKQVISNGYQIEPIHWNGINSTGEKLRNGVYVYKLEVTDQRNEQIHVFQKLVIAR